jgi:hypothetical protein
MDSFVSDAKASVKENRLKKRLCALCEINSAEFCIRGLEKDCYCRQCAEEQFGDLELLEKL